MIIYKLEGEHFKLLMRFSKPIIERNDYCLKIKMMMINVIHIILKLLPIYTINNDNNNRMRISVHNSMNNLVNNNNNTNENNINNVNNRRKSIDLFILLLYKNTRFLRRL